MIPGPSSCFAPCPFPPQTTAAKLNWAKPQNLWKSTPVFDFNSSTAFSRCTCPLSGKQPVSFVALSSSSQPTVAIILLPRRSISRTKTFSPFQCHRATGRPNTRPSREQPCQGHKASARRRGTKRSCRSSSRAFRATIFAPIATLETQVRMPSWIVCSSWLSTFRVSCQLTINL